MFFGRTVCMEFRPRGPSLLNARTSHWIVGSPLRRLSSQAQRQLNSDVAKPAILWSQRIMKYTISAALFGSTAVGMYYYLKTEYALSPEGFRKIELVDRKDLDDSTSILSFIPHDMVIGGTGKSLNPFGNIPDFPSFIYFLNDQCFVARAYTPLPIIPGSNKLEFLIKNYPDGVVTPFLWKLKPGDTIRVRGPITALHYEPNSVRNLGLIAGGTGITPILSLIRHICHNTEDMTKITLIYCNRNDKSIYLKKELDDLQKRYSGQLSIIYSLDELKDTQKETYYNSKSYHIGLIDKEFLKSKLPPPSDNHSTGVMVCGSEGFLSYVSGPKKNDNDPGPVGGLLKQLGYTSFDIYKF